MQQYYHRPNNRTNLLIIMLITALMLLNQNNLDLIYNIYTLMHTVTLEIDICMYVYVDGLLV